MDGIALFPTALGSCGIAWNMRGITSVQLPEGDELATRARLVRRSPDSSEVPPPPEIRVVIDRIARLLAGSAVTFDDVSLDMSGVPPFHQRVYELARTIPAGTTLSYGDLARRLGDPGAARAVGQALARNPFAPIVPCHRVLGARGASGGFSAHGGLATKRRLLALEGVSLAAALPLFDED